MKTVKKNQYNNYNNNNNNRNETMVVVFNIIAYTAMILLGYSAYFIIFDVILAGKIV